MADKIKIIYGKLSVMDSVYGYVTFDGSKWTLDEEAWKKECAAIANAGANAVRILPYAVWDPRPFGRRSQFSPWVLDEAKNLWDLSRFNGYYFPIARRIVEIANAYGLEVWLPWFDSCQLQPGTWTGMSPWKHNLQGVSHFYDRAADPYAKAWLRRIVEELSGCSVFWPWGNELDQPQFPEWAKRALFPLIEELKIPFEKMTYGATMPERTYFGNGQFSDEPGTYQDIARRFFGEEFPPESNKFKVAREVHACGRKALDAKTPYGHRPHQAAYWWGNKPVGKFVLSDDGVLDQGGSDGGRPSAERWNAMATWALQYNNLGGLEHLPEKRDIEYQAVVVESISKAYKAKFGGWPENHGKWHYEPPEPEPDPEPEPIPEPEPNHPGIDWRIIAGVAAALALAILLLVVL